MRAQRQRVQPRREGRGQRLRLVVHGERGEAGPERIAARELGEPRAHVQPHDQRAQQVDGDGRARARRRGGEQRAEHPHLEGDIGRYREIWAGIARYGEIWRDMGRYREM